ncbi:hypothetical protein L228DRAFT_96573 [Xylona heveae TC161]|uniref:Uncharacterized protein n=1 Tax=Xylona heveae (strain CBS 132557 / TC161) TaxID=1328760 RepID=A0A161TQ57_XYLHT|nr:hypothetical protein L228DRAFT_96573 [Xylona heveae TC161]KZF24436.1 hypothetical protein L228DRAFT_96573 [Xylona heveae TC161]
MLMRRKMYSEKLGFRLSASCLTNSEPARREGEECWPTGAHLHYTVSFEKSLSLLPRRTVRNGMRGRLVRREICLRLRHMSGCRQIYFHISHHPDRTEGERGKIMTRWTLREEVMTMMASTGRICYNGWQEGRERAIKQGGGSFSSMPILYRAAMGEQI